MISKCTLDFWWQGWGNPRRVGGTLFFPLFYKLSLTTPASEIGECETKFGLQTFGAKNTNSDLFLTIRSWLKGWILIHLDLYTRCLDSGSGLYTLYTHSVMCESRHLESDSGSESRHTSLIDLQHMLTITTRNHVSYCIAKTMGLL